MLNEEYIASGILELYAAGGLTEAEREEVERQAALSPEIRSELDEACAAMEAYAGLYARTPTSGLKTRIMKQLAREEANVRTLPIESLREPSTHKQGTLKYNPSFKTKREVNDMLGWAALFFIIAVVAGVFGFFGIASAAVGIAKFLFFLFLILFVLTLIMGRRKIKL